jgi:DNA-binding MarR family transcriptional regulator|tara:strand:+ start:227 stop:412 length:186 start_codon:yes stop_codon:yes gene_type:complete
MEQMNNPFEEKQTTGKSLRQFKLSAESIAVLDAIRKTNKATNSEIIETLLLKAGQNLVRGE